MFLFFGPEACGSLTRVELAQSTLGGGSLNHWISREDPETSISTCDFLLFCFHLISYLIAFIYLLCGFCTPYTDN